MIILALTVGGTGYFSLLNGLALTTQSKVKQALAQEGDYLRRNDQASYYKLSGTLKEIDVLISGLKGKIGELVEEIAAASSEQAHGIDQVNMAFAEMDKAVQRNAANAEESASASEEMTAQAEQMKALVNDLVALVRGAGKSAGTGDYVETSGRAPGRNLETTPPKHISDPEDRSRGNSPVKPGKIIPLDDGDFRDF